MCPQLFHIGPFPVYGFGLMLAIGFIVASSLLTSEFKRRSIDPNAASVVTLIALLAGIAGSKALFLIENWKEFLADPAGMAFNPGGLTFYGGFILAAVSIYVYGRMKNIRFLVIADSISPGLLLGYGIARIGCHLAGDGDYGFPTTLPWGTDYSKGTYPPSVAFRDFPEITRNYPNGVVPDHTLCQPTPVYEFLICAIFFLILWRLRKRLRPDGLMFMLYLVFAGVERFSIEFMRLNPRIAFGLSEAQLISIGLIALGAIGWYRLSSKTSASAR